MHDLQGICKVVASLVVLSVEMPDRESPGILSLVIPVDREYNIYPLSLFLAITEMFLEYLPEQWVIWMITIPNIRKRRVRIIDTICGGRERGSIPVW